MQGEAETVRLEGGLLADLYTQHAPDALRLAYLLTGDRALAEDLVQDAFVRLAGRLLHLRSQAGFHVYLRTTMVNLVRSIGRRRAVERRFAQNTPPPRAVEGPDISDRDQMRSALMSLPTRQRAAIVLRFYEDLSEIQTADVMRCRPPAVRSLVARGMSTLRATLGDA